MSTSIPVLNRNTQLPPLLLPASRPLERSDPFGMPFAMPFAKPFAKRAPRDLDDEGLERLAQLATKRPRLDAAATAGPTPSPSPPRAAAAASVSASVSAASSGGAGASSGGAAAELPSSSSRRSSAPAASAAAPAAAAASHRGASKRQRSGPSCDGCRLKKIKCDAHVEVLYQGPAVTRLGSDRLHQVVSRDQVLAQLPVQVPPLGDSSLLIKHIDKIILFRPCTSCAKRRASLGELHDHTPGSPPDDAQQQQQQQQQNAQVTHVTDAGSVSSGACVFSKGFTRADINVFAKITKRVGQRPVQEMTLQDYRKAGFE